MPPGRIKIMEALKSLMKEKNFEAITWMEIAKTAAVNEGLIYKYFRNKRNLLHEVMEEFQYEFFTLLYQELEGVEGALNKIKTFIFSTLKYFQHSRLYVRIILIEVRTYPDYFKTESYEKMRIYVNALKSFIREGVQNGEIRDDIPIQRISQMILGIIEHMMLPKLIFEQPMDFEGITEDICKFVYMGIEKKKNSKQKKISTIKQSRNF